MFLITIYSTQIFTMGLKEGCYCMGTFLLSIILFALAFSGLTLGIASVVIGAKWHDCHLNKDDVDAYLIVVGSIMIAGFVCHIIWGKKNEDDVGNNSYSTIIGIATMGALAWGMTILWNSEQGDCSKGQYDYAYYMTYVLTFFTVALIAIIFIAILVRACLI